MLPVLQARASISRINEGSLAAGQMGKREAEEYTFNLQQASTRSGLSHRATERRTAYRPTSPQEMAGLAGVGTSVIVGKGPSAGDMARQVEEAAAAKAAR